MSKRFMILRKNVGTDAQPGKPELAFPTIGTWYAGATERGTGAVAKYEGWNEFTLGDGTVVDMTKYDHLVER